MDVTSLPEVSSDERMRRFIAILHADPVFKKVSDQHDPEGFTHESFAGAILGAAHEAGLRTP